jgi:hypothetical protein
MSAVICGGLDDDAKPYEEKELAEAMKNAQQTEYPRLRGKAKALPRKKALKK